ARASRRAGEEARRVELKAKLAAMMMTDLMLWGRAERKSLSRRRCKSASPISRGRNLLSSSGGERMLCARRNLLRETSHGRWSGLDCSHHHRRYCRVAGRAIHEKQHGAADEYCAWHRRGGDCQRDLERDWDPPRGMDRLPDCRLYRSLLADL